MKSSAINCPNTCDQDCSLEGARLLRKAIKLCRVRILNFHRFSFIPGTKTFRKLVQSFFGSCTTSMAPCTVQ